jgi:hypothetical protein
MPSITGNEFDAAPNTDKNQYSMFCTVMKTSQIIYTGVGTGTT